MAWIETLVRHWYALILHCDQRDSNSILSSIRSVYYKEEYRGKRFKGRQLFLDICYCFKFLHSIFPSFILAFVHSTAMVSLTWTWTTRAVVCSWEFFSTWPCMNTNLLCQGLYSCYSDTSVRGRRCYKRSNR